MKKARSRLATSSSASEPVGNRAPRSAQPKLVVRYLKHLPTLVVAIPFGLAIWYILTQVHPDTIAHFILPNTYLPLLLAVFGFTFFAASYLLLNARRGVWLSLLVTIFLFFKLQQVVFSWQIVAVPLLIFFVLEAILTYLRR